MLRRLALLAALCVLSSLASAQGFNNNCQVGGFNCFGGAGQGGPTPSLNLNFIAMEASGLDPRITFTRASSATVFNASGVRVQVGSDVPRFDHTTAGVPLGLLIEESRTNQLFNSTVPATQTTGSLGTGTYTLWVEGSGSATMSAGTGTGCGTSAATANNPVNFTITVAGTCTVTVAGSLTAFQLELGSFATSLIITAGATGTRAADVASMGVTPWVNTSQGTILTTFDTIVSSAAVNNQVALSLGDGTNNERIFLGRAITTGTSRGLVVAGAATQADLRSVGTIAANTQVNLVFAYKANDFASSLNGEAVATDLAGSVPTISTLLIGNNNAGASFLNGHLVLIQYWPTRRLNGQVEQLAR